MTIEKIFSSKHRFAIILRDGHEPDGTMFYTDKEDTFQLGTIKHETGYIELPHIHKKKEKLHLDVVESLHVVYGKVAVDFFEDERKYSEVILNPGDTALLIEGTHRIRVLESFKGVKVKQGPYQSIEDDKEFVKVIETDIN
tara:strand:- start:647 stop:1069 length:423 start_codon:yes stop_codon:yes gene_type:complete